MIKEKKKKERRKKKVMNINKIRDMFYIINDNEAYLDNAATTQKPKEVIYAYAEYYKKYNGNGHSSMNKYGFESNVIYDKTKEKIANFLGAEKEGIVFTKSATEAVNLIANNLSSSFGSDVLSSPKNTILISKIEHHANILPYREHLKKLISKGKVNVEYVNISSGFLDYNDFEKKLDSNVKVISLTMGSNVTGEIIDIDRINNIIDSKFNDGAGESRPLLILDASQVVGHKRIEVSKLNVDFLFFSAHKMYGPLGVGVLYINPKHIRNLSPLIYGGGIVDKVTEDSAKYYSDSRKFDAGTKDVASIYAFSKAIDFIESVGIDNIEKHVNDLGNYFTGRLNEITGVKIYSKEKDSSIVTFNLEGIHGHDVSSILSHEGIYVRGGSHCAHILHDSINEKSTVRASFAIYNTYEEIDKAIYALNKIIERFKK